MKDSELYRAGLARSSRAREGKVASDPCWPSDIAETSHSSVESLSPERELSRCMDNHASRAPKPVQRRARCLCTLTVFSLLTLLTLGTLGLAWAEEPCGQYPVNKQARCERLWKEINEESVAEMARFGMDQLKRRQEGKITQEQHLQENMSFIKQSAEKRLRLLSERMRKE